MADDLGLTALPKDRERHVVRIRVLVLGPLAVEANGQPVHVAGSHRRRLLALLASQPGRLASVDSIVDALWGDDPPPTALKTVQAHVARLRRSFEGASAQPIETSPGGYRLAIEPAAVDAVRFETLAAEGHRRLRGGDHAAAVEALSESLELWRGPAYVEFGDADFVRAESTRLEELRLAALEELAEAQLGMGGAASAIPGLERLVTNEPGRERAWGLLMRALYAAGRQHDALDAFQRARHALADSFGLEPGHDLRALERQIVEQDATLAPVTGRTLLAAALRFSTPFIGRAGERSALDAAWDAARAGDGQLRVVRGVVDSGRTRLAADLAGRVIADGGDVEYTRGSDLLAGVDPGTVVDAVSERSRLTPLLLVIDDTEWASEEAIGVVVALARAVDQFALLVVVILDASAGGPAVAAIERLDADGALTIEVGVLADDELAAIVAADGVEAGAIPAVVGVAAGKPGVARREAAAWAERTASERLRAAASSSVGAATVAGRAQASVLDEVLELVAARARRDELRSPRWAGRQPYRSLATYGPQDAELFVGRERLVAEMAARVLERRLVVVVGPSGSGKSSLVRAGLVPLARSGRLPGDRPWRTHVVVPGRDPLAALDALDDLDDASPQLLVVDQFEEVFSALPGTVESLAQRLVALAGDPTLDVHVVLVVRADEFGSLTAVPGLVDAVESAQLVVGPPTDDELRRIVIEPARRTGVAVEPALVDLVASDVGGYDAALPLVSAAMAEVWVRRDGGVLRADRYLEIGGIANAVERLGEQALGQADADAVHHVMLALADVTDEGVWTRRRVPIDELAREHVAAVEALVEARLVVRAEETIEVVHEVVFRAWPLLAGWLEDARADLMLERELRGAARIWDAEGRSDDTVYRGGRLQSAIEWTDRQPSVPQQVVAFIDAGRDRSERDSQQMRDQLAREVRARRRLGRALAGASALLIVAIVAAGVAAVSRARAQDERRRAQDAQAIAEQERGRAEDATDVAVQRGGEADAARAVADDERDQARVARLVAESERELDSHLDLGLLLAAEAYQRADTPETRGALLTSLTHNMSSELPSWVSRGISSQIDRTPSAFLGFMPGPPGRAIGLAVSDNGGVVATARYEHETTCSCGLVIVFDTATRRELVRVEIPFPMGLGVDLSPDGRNALASSASEIYVIDVAAATTRTVATTPRAGVNFSRPFFRADGAQFVVPADDGSLSLWDTTSLERIDITLPTSPLGLARIAPDGSLAIGLPDPAVMLWDIDAGIERRTVSLEAVPPDKFLDKFAFSADGSMLAASEDLGQVFIWDLTTGRLRGDPAGRPGATRTIAFAPDSSTLAVASANGGITLYDVGREESLGEAIRGHGAGASQVAFSADGRYLVSAGDDGLIGLWGDNAGAGLIVQPITEPSVGGPDYSADGSRLLVYAGDHVEIRDGLNPGAAGLAIRPAAPNASVPFEAKLSDDGSTVLLAIQTEPWTLIVADASTGATRWSAQDPEFPVLNAAISADGRLVAAYDGARMRLWDLVSGNQLGELWGDTVVTDASAHAVTPKYLAGPAFTADGRYVDVSVGTEVLRLDAADLHVVSRASSPVVLFDLAEVPGTDDVIGAGVTGRVFRWNMVTGEMVAAGQSPDSSRLEAVTVSHDGSLVAAYHSFPSRLAIFDAATLRPIGRPFPVGDFLFTPEFTADDRFLAGNGMWLNSATHWTMEPTVWLATACRAAGRNLTQAEWGEYLGAEEPYQPTCPAWPGL